MRISNRLFILPLLAALFLALLFVPRTGVSVLAQTDDPDTEVPITGEVTAEVTAEVAETDQTAEATESVTDNAAPLLTITEEAATGEAATEEPDEAVSGETGAGEIEPVEAGQETENQAALGRLMLVLGVLAVGVTGVVMIMRERNALE